MKEKVTKIKCDFCNAEIEKSTPVITTTADPDNTGIDLGVEIRVFWADGKRFTSDICRNCVFKAVASVAPSAFKQAGTIDYEND